MKNILKIYVVLLFILSFSLKGQTPNSVGIGTTNPNNSSILHLESSNQGFLMPRLTTAQISAISAPTVGLIVYNKQDQCYWYKHPIGWKRICNTDSLGNIFITSLTTNTLVANTATINNVNFNTALGDSIIVSYVQTNTLVANTATIISLTTNTLNSQVVNTNSLNIGGNSIQNIITDSITKQAWLLKGNLGTNPATNFLGTKDNKDLVFRTNNTEKVRVTSTGSVGIGTTAPTEMLDVTQKIRLRLGASNGYVLQSNATGVGTWTSVASLVSVLSPTALNNQAWTILGNSATNPTVNFIGTTDNNDLIIKTNNIVKATVKSNSTDELTIGTNTNNAHVTFGNLSFSPGVWVGGNRYIGMNLKRNGLVWNVLSSGTNNGANYLANDVYGNLSIGSIPSTGASTLSLNDATVASYTKFKFKSNRQYLIDTSVYKPIISYLTDTTSGLSFDPKTTSLASGLHKFYVKGVEVAKIGTVRSGNNTYGTNYKPSLIVDNNSTTGPNLGLLDGPLLIGVNNTLTVSGIQASGFKLLGNNNKLDLGSGVSNNIIGDNNDLTCFRDNYILGSRNKIIGVGNTATQFNYLACSDVTFDVTGSGLQYSNIMARNPLTVLNPSSATIIDGSRFWGSNLTVNGGSKFWGIFQNNSGALPALLTFPVEAIGSVNWLASGGMNIYLNNALTNSAKLPAGGGSWSYLSDINTKTNLKDLSNKDILDKLNSVNVKEWQYIEQDPKYNENYKVWPTHIGPMAQDFNKVFGYGEYSNMISSGDMDGILFSSVQALSEENKAMKKELEEQRVIINELKKYLESKK